MNFRSINKFNVVVNALSGNCFPLSEEKIDVNLLRAIYVTLTWLVKLIFLSTTTIGLLSYVPAFEALQMGAVNTIVSLEMLTLSAYLNSQRGNLRNLIRKINGVLDNSDILRQCINDTVEPHKKRLKVYTIATVGSVLMWAFMPIMRILETDRFTHSDFVLPTYLPVESISVSVFVFSVIVEVLGSTCVIFKKIGIDVYVNYLITLLTAEYHYVHEQISDALRQENCEEDADNKSAVASLQKCVQYQCNVMEIGQMLRKLLAVNVGLTYLSCVLRFCFLAFFIITIPGSYFEKSMYLVFAIGMLMQVYMFCSCCQELLEASTSITDDAFHEDWYGRGSTVKRIFRTIGLSNRMECRLSAYRIVDLTVPSFVAILNQAYSVCLLLLRFKFNVVMNTLSGNFLPMTGEKTSLGFLRTTYLIFTWIVETIYLASTAIGLIFIVPAVVAVRDGGVSAIVGIEMMILAPYLNFRSDRLRNLIRKMNSILVDSEKLKRCIRNCVDPHKERLKIYTVVTVSAVIMWAALPALKLLEEGRRSFTYTDFVIPTYYPGEPFTADNFFWGVAFETVGAAYLILKKSSVDVYVSYLITLLTAEYRYVHEQIADALVEVHDEKSEESIIESLQTCIQHHCVVMEIGHMLSEILSLNIGLTYVNCIVRFCCLGFTYVTVSHLQSKAICVTYMMGTVVQVYMLCLGVEELLEASTTVTDGAFHENWYERGNVVKSIFRTMGLGNRVECRLTAFRIVDLTVPTFAKILNQAYSVCLLLLRAY